MNQPYGNIQPGDRVKLVRCSDPYTRLTPGTEGTFQGAHEVKSLGFTQISIEWDDGSRLMMVPEDGDEITKA